MKKININNTDDGKEKPYLQWARTLLAVFSFLMLVSPLRMLENISNFFIHDKNKIIFIDNWMVWIVVFFFALGWFVTQWFEIAILTKKPLLAKSIIVAFLIGNACIAFYFGFASNSEVLNHFGVASESLSFSGSLLRQSMFRYETFIMLKNMFVRVK